jgi:ribosomal protein S6--L-glutamate ligase
VIETTLILGDRRASIRVTLTDRGDMLFPMLVGRTALAGDLIVDPSRRDVLGRPR